MDILTFRFHEQGRNHKDSNFFDLLNTINTNYRQYLACRSIRCLNSFLNGYYYIEYPLITHKGAINVKDSFSNFIHWVEKKYKFSSPHSWISIILLHSHDEIEAFDNFFLLLDEFGRMKAQGSFESLSEYTEHSDNVGENYEIEFPIQMMRYDRNLLELLNDIENRPKLYLDTYSLSHLYCFLQGYAQAKNDYGLEVSSDEMVLLKIWIRLVG